MLVLSAWLLLTVLPMASFGALDPASQAFVQKAVPVGRIVFSGAVEAANTTYELFLLQQQERRGVLVLAHDQTDQRHVIYADTSLDMASDRSSVSAEVLEQFYVLLGFRPRAPGALSVVAAVDDIAPVGAVLSTVLGPIAGLTFRKNSTCGILQELERCDAIPVNPVLAPIGAILVCPTSYSSEGPVSLGSVVIVGSDYRVYGPDFRKGGAWTPFGPLKEWVSQNSSTNQVFGFLLRAHLRAAKHETVDGLWTGGCRVGCFL